MKRTEYPSALRELITQLRQLPGVGPRSAERIALWIVQAREQQPENIAQAIATTRATIHPCAKCGFFATAELCDICADEGRATELLCVVEQPTDILPLEKTSAFRGRYHSLGGRISPLDRVAPEDLRIASLLERVEKEAPKEIIFALAADVEGEATTNYLVDLLKKYLDYPDPHRARPARRWRPRVGRRIDPLARPLRPDETVASAAVRDPRPFCHSEPAQRGEGPLSCNRRFLQLRE